MLPDRLKFRALFGTRATCVCKSSDTNRMMDAGRSSQKKRDNINKEKEERERRERKACDYRSQQGM